MNPWFGNSLVLFGIIMTFVIRFPHGLRSLKIRIIDNKKGKLETVLLALMWVAIIILPIMAMATPVFAFADYTLRPVPFVCGTLAMMAYLWLFYRSHADLGTNWSVSLQVRENQKIITSGVYKKIRHPMYASVLFYSVAQALLLPNWVAGPSCLVTFALMFMLRVNAEERMMLETFGQEYESYINRTKRLIPGVY
jgi:protein-S-isoprenylcysteine O-methyltransferase Ste14